MRIREQEQAADVEGERKADGQKEREGEGKRERQREGEGKRESIDIEKAERKKEWTTHLNSNMSAMMKVLKLLCSLMALPSSSPSARLPNNYTHTEVKEVTIQV